VIAFPRDADPTPSLRSQTAVTVRGGDDLTDIDALAVPVRAGGPVPADLGDAAALARCGFTGALGQTMVVPTASGPELVAVGVGAAGEFDLTALRDVAAEFARAVPQHYRLGVRLPDASLLAAGAAAQAIVEGVLLARWAFTLSKKQPPRLESLVLLAAESDVAAAAEGARRGHVVADACSLGRDLANCPGGIMSAARIADVAVEVGATSGLTVEVFGKDELIEMGCGGLLGVNLGSVEPPRMIKLTYVPDESLGAPTGRLTLVGKGIMYDSGGISLKPSDASHSTMKNDMSGAGSVLAAMSALSALGCRTAVVGYMMCTDNMPSGSAVKLGDVLSMRGGTTVEVLNTDAEGRLVMGDALVLATEEPTDAIVDLATLTGACLRTFGTEIAGVMGNHQALIEQVIAAGDETDEPVYQLPLARRYRSQLNSDVADMSNMGGPNAGSITAALFLEEFVAGLPWAHIDIAGTAQADAPRTWRPKGATGFGTNLLIELALKFKPVAGGSAA
jgi:leucyl aminopeptidase